MSKLLAIIDAYKDTHGQPSDASIARAVDIAPQTLSSWRKRGIRDLPEADTIRRLSDFLRVSYVTVFHAAAVDAGYLDAMPASEDPDPPQSGEVRGA